jgi:hypothetical protein
MKKIYLLITVSIFGCLGLVGQQINISTGLGVNNTNEPTWKAGTAVPATSTPYINHASSVWEPNPVATNAKWIIPSSNNGMGQTTYYYERPFSVSAGIKLLSLNINVTADDVLNNIELVRPNNTVITIPFGQSTTGYKFTKEVIDSANCPTEGIWKLRVKTFCADDAGNNKLTGLLVSGYVNLVKGDCGTAAPVATDPCCPPWNKEIMKNFMVYSGSGNISAPYTLLFQPNAAFNNQMQAYINYHYCPTKI